MRDWLLNFKKISVDPRTCDWHLNIAKANVFSEIGQIPIKSLTAYHIQNLLNSKLNSGSSPRKVKAIRDVINQCLKHACETGILSNNPASATKIQKKIRTVVEKDEKGNRITVKTVKKQA
jgi:hypothetical protein